MGRLSLMVLSLAVWLFAANSLPDVNEAQLEHLVPEILNRYRPIYSVGGQWKSPMFSLVVRIPFNRNTEMYDLNKVTDDAGVVTRTIIDCEVYAGPNILAATVLRWPDVVAQCPNGRVQWRLPRGNRARTWAQAYNLNPPPFHEGIAVHAEYRTLQNLNNWLNDHNIGQRDLLLIYVFFSPCDTRCTNGHNGGNILQYLRDMSQINIVFVFSKVFRPRNNEPIPAENLRGALESLGGAIGLSRIFRCDTVNGVMKCVNCRNNGNVAGWCYDDNQQPA